MRQEEKEGGGERLGRRETKRLTQSELIHFSYFDLKQILTVFTVQAADSEISPSGQAPQHLIQTESPSVCQWFFSVKKECLKYLEHRNKLEM